MAEDSSCFSVASFNILARDYCRPAQYLYVDPKFLRFSYRFELLKNIYKRSNASILQLQEVDQEEDHISVLKDMGYEVVYDKRTLKKNDGLITAVKKDMFTIVEKSVFHYDEIADSCLVYKDRYRKGNIVQVLVLKCEGNIADDRNENDRLVIAANTHLFWNPKYEDVKLLQTQALLLLVGKYREKFPTASVVISGDFNSNPDSFVYRYILNGEVKVKQPSENAKLVLDTDCRKISRYLRAIGVDAAMNKDATLDDMFAQCISENRVFSIVTHSKTAVSRRNCPRHVLLSNATIEEDFRYIVTLFGFKVDSEKVYTHCVECNGDFDAVLPEQYHEMDVPDGLKGGYDRAGNSLTFFKCKDCLKIYWWGAGTNKGVERIMSMIDDNDCKSKLEDIVRIRSYLDPLPVQKQVRAPYSPKRVEETKSDLVEVEDVKAVYVIPSLDLDDAETEVIDINDKNIDDGVWRIASCDFTHSLNLQTAYKAPVPTNVTVNFCGSLDHIFYNRLTCIGTKELPTYESIVENGYLPNSSWPSDHLQVQAYFKF